MSRDDDLPALVCALALIGLLWGILIVAWWVYQIAREAAHW